MIIILYFIFPYVMKFLSGVKWLVVLFYMLFALLILYLYRLSNGEYFLVADEFINVFYVIQSKMNPERVLLHPFRIVSIKIRYQSSDQFIFSTFRIALALPFVTSMVNR